MMLDEHIMYAFACCKNRTLGTAGDNQMQHVHLGLHAHDICVCS